MTTPLALQEMPSNLICFKETRLSAGTPECKWQYCSSVESPEEGPAVSREACDLSQVELVSTAALGQPREPELRGTRRQEAEFVTPFIK